MTDKPPHLKNPSCPPPADLDPPGDIPMGRLEPDYASPPGDTLLETLEALGLSVGDLAERARLPETELRSVIEDHSPINADIAERLESALQVPKDFWLALDRQYRDRRSRLDAAGSGPG